MGLRQCRDDYAIRNHDLRIARHRYGALRNLIEHSSPYCRDREHAPMMIEAASCAPCTVLLTIVPVPSLKIAQYTSPSALPQSRHCSALSVYRRPLADSRRHQYCTTRSCQRVSTCLRCRCPRPNRDRCLPSFPTRRCLPMSVCPHCRCHRLHHTNGIVPDEAIQHAQHSIRVDATTQSPAVVALHEAIANSLAFLR